VCRGLFEAHKGIFSFLIASAIQRDAGIIHPGLWGLLLRGSAAGIFVIMFKLVLDLLF
jgi:hypothetical protein